MKKGEGPVTIDFASRGRELQERKAREEADTETKLPAKAVPERKAVEEPAERVVHLEIPKPVLRVVPQPERFNSALPLSLSTFEPEEPRSGLNLRVLSRLDVGNHGLDLIGRDLLGLLAGPEDRKKLDRLVMVETALRGLFVKPANVAMRRGMVRSYGTDDLTAQFWGSTESNWTQQPAMYTAIIDELEERGFFNIRNVPPPPPTLPAEPTGRRSRRSAKKPPR